MNHYPRLVRFALAIAATSMLVAGAARGATFYLVVDNANDWNTLSNWNSAPDGTGSAPLTLAGNDFDTNGYTVRADGSDNFGGDSLTINGGAWLIKRGGNAATVPLLVSNGGSILAAKNTDNRPTPGAFINNATTTLDILAQPQMHLVTASLTGAGDLAITSTGSSICYLVITDASGYTGTVTWGDANTTVLNFDTDLTTAGGLLVPATGRIELDQNVTFTSATIDGIALAPGTHSYAELNTAYDDIFLDGGSGSITVVPEPATLALLAIGGLMTITRRRHA